MKDELASVLDDPIFARSPVLSRLLVYLVEESLKGHAARLKSYTVAVDGLGRSEGYDSQIDTYSRVQIGRLRRALDAYYREAGAACENRLSIGPGSYEIRLEPNASLAGTASDGASGPPRQAGNRRSLTAALLIVSFVLVFAALAFWSIQHQQEEARHWQTNNFPRILISVESAEPGNPVPADLAIAEKIGDMVRPYETVRLADRSSADVGYVMRLKFRPAPGGRIIDIDVSNVRLNREIFSEEIPISGSAELTDSETLQIRRTIYALLGSSGRLTALENRNSFSADTPFDCWLRFVRSVNADELPNTSAFSRCATDWFGHAPEHHIAAALYAWSLTSKALGTPLRSRNEQQLVEAAQLLEKALSANPDSRIVRMSLARTYAAMGYTDSLIRLAREAPGATQENPDAANMIGTLIVLQNDLSGEAQIDASIAFNPNPPPRYFIGKFIAAMMREDIAAAGQALQLLTAANRTGRWGQIFKAAYLARTGKTAAAKAAWLEGTSEYPVARHFPRVVVANAPASDAVKSRMLKWLQPALE